MPLSGQAALPPMLAHGLRWRLLSELARGDPRVRELAKAGDRRLRPCTPPCLHYPPHR